MKDFDRNWSLIHFCDGRCSFHNRRGEGGGGRGGGGGRPKGLSTIGTISNDDDDDDDDDDGSEKVAKKWICVLSNLIASSWTHSICQIQANFPGVEFLRIFFKLKKRKENSSSYVHVLSKNVKLGGFMS